MKTVLVSPSERTSVSSDAFTMDTQAMDTQTTSGPRGVGPEASRVYDLEVLVCRVGDGETRARAANLPLPESRRATVREALQTIIESARQLINDSAAREGGVPWIVPSTLPEDNESRFVVPLVV